MGERRGYIPSDSSRVSNDRSEPSSAPTPPGASLRRYPEALKPPTFLPHPGSRFFSQSENEEHKDGDKDNTVGTGRGVDEKGVYRVWEDSINEVR